MALKDELILEQIQIGPMQNFTYLIGCQRTREVALVDPAWDIEALMEIVGERDYKVHSALVTHYHPDHCAASALSAAASWFAASKGRKTASAALEQAPALWWMDTLDMIGFEPHFYVDVSDHVDLKRRMLLCHRSQLARSDDAAFMPLDALMMRQCEARGAQSGVRASEAFRQYGAWKRIGAW